RQTEALCRQKLIEHVDAAALAGGVQLIVDLRQWLLQTQGDLAVHRAGLVQADAWRLALLVHQSWRIEVLDAAGELRAYLVGLCLQHPDRVGKRITLYHFGLLLPDAQTYLLRL